MIVATVIVTAVNVQGKRKVFSLDMVSTGDGAGW